MKRVAAFRANHDADSFLQELNQLVLEGESVHGADRPPDLPVVLIVGPPRSGTTLLTQWLNQSGLAVPSNIAARFTRVPLFAGRLQRLLTDPALNYRNELASAPATGFESDYGKTSGLLSPHEFSFFIRRFFPVRVGEPLTPEELARADVAGFLDGLRHFASGMNCPVAVKGLLVQYCLGLFAGQRNVVFLHSHRDEADNVVSLLSHRQKVADDPNEWLSVRPAEYDWLRHLSPVEQVAGQVHFTNAALRRQFAAFPGLVWLDARHEEFCANPADLHGRLSAAFMAMGQPPLPAYQGPDRFDLRHYDRAGDAYRSARQALDRLPALAPSDNRT